MENRETKWRKDNFKDNFIEEISPILKSEGYKRKRNYWYLLKNNVVFCINVQGSQWDKNNYYVNIGAKNNICENYYPTALQWTWSHRCTDTSGSENNISIKDFIKCKDVYFDDFVSLKVDEFYNKYNAIKICEQWVLI